MKRIIQIIIVLICLSSVLSFSFIFGKNKDNSTTAPGDGTTVNDTALPNEEDDKNPIEVVDNKSANEISDDEGFYDMGQWMGFDFKKLGVKPHTYDTTETFELSYNMQEAITNMYSVCGNWYSGFASQDDNWKDSFIRSFILNSWYEPEYIHGKGTVTKEEIEYVQYSLTGARLSFPMADDEIIDRSESSSPFNEAHMESYSISKRDDGYLIYANILKKVKYINLDGDIEIRDDYDYVAIELKENPYSCFEGYSINSITMMPTQVKDYDEEFFELVSMLIWHNGNIGISDYLVADFLGEDIDLKTITLEDGQKYNSYKRVPADEMKRFYKEVWGEDRSFGISEDHMGEICVYCDEDGYCYAINGAGYPDYTVISNVNNYVDYISVTAYLMNGVTGEEAGVITFNLIPSDNEFGYVVKKYTEEEMIEGIRKRYPYVPPFYCVLDHFEDDGSYVFHLYEVVDNIVEQHTATVEWFIVNPYDGSIIELFDSEVFNITDAPDLSYGCENAYQAYTYFIFNSGNFEWDKFYQEDYYDFDGFQLIDLDSDTDPELIATISNPDRFDNGMQTYVTVDFEKDRFFINEIHDGVAGAGGYRGDKYYIPGKGIIYDISYDAPYGAPGSSIYVYEVGILELKEYGYLSPNADYEYPKNLEIGTWYWCDNEVTEKEYDYKLKNSTLNFSGQALKKIEYMDKESFLKLLSEKLYN